MKKKLCRFQTWNEVIYFSNGPPKKKNSATVRAAPRRRAGPLKFVPEPEVMMEPENKAILQFRSMFPTGSRCTVSLTGHDMQAKKLKGRELHSMAVLLIF